MKKSFAAYVFILFALPAAGLFAGDNKWTGNGPYGGMFQDFTFHPNSDNVIFASISKFHHEGAYIHHNIHHVHWIMEKYPILPR